MINFYQPKDIDLIELSNQNVLFRVSRALFKWWLSEFLKTEKPRNGFFK